MASNPSPTQSSPSRVLLAYTAQPEKVPATAGAAGEVEGAEHEEVARTMAVAFDAAPATARTVKVRANGALDHRQARWAPAVGLLGEGGHGQSAYGRDRRELEAPDRGVHGP